ncbi:MAG TPA: PIN/TRAM domain-containing protein [Phycisphaerales bacterium]|nr:PIN/TRAM domain-containing protein [Phycisphaerales bacterium]
MIIHIVRALYLVVVLAFTVYYATTSADAIQQGPTYLTMYILIPAVAAFAIIMVDMFYRRKRLQLMSGLFFGLLAGLVIAYVLGQIVDLVLRVYPTLQNDPIVALVKVLLGVSAVFACVSFVMQTKDDFRFVIPYVEFSKQTKGSRPSILDTSVIIDGRIADISETRILMDSQIVVPRFILAELQAIADSDDKLKRNRGRRGLDVLNRLRTSDKLEIRILDTNIPTVEEQREVDAKLVALAGHLDGRILTNDYNLNKIAQLRGVDVININDLANALKPVVLPGESMSVKIIRPGEEPGQGVGYLEDGTMVVAEQGRDYIGQTITISVTSALQTSAGRMIFGRLDPNKSFSRERKS